jgi:phosphate transport system substrate-binding protein
MRKELSAAVAALSAVIILAGCGQKRQAVTLAGSTAFQPFAEKLADQFMQQNPEINVTVQGGGSAVGIQSTLSQAADIGMADLVELPEEARHLVATEVARDGIAIVVNPQNPVAGLTSQQVRDIFSGAISNWKQVGGDDRPVTVVSREAGSGTRSSFEQILGKISLTREALIQDSNGTIRETVANDANAVGYLSHGLINDKIKPVKVDGADCTTPEIISGSYKLVRPVYLLTLEPPSGPVKQVIDYMLSPEGQSTIDGCGLIPVKK